MSSTIRFEFINDKVLRVTAAGTVLFDYNFRPETDARFCPRPFMHPIRTLAGDVVTNSRPTDHPWHNGLSMTLTDVSGTNFWGGGTYRREAGTYGEYDNMGRQDHREWLPVEQAGGAVSFVEKLDWIGARGELFFKETRTLTVRDVDARMGRWRLVWETVLENVTGQDLVMNSYCSGEGLQGSGYTGLFLRLSRGYTQVPDYIHRELPSWTDYHDGESVIESPEAVNGWKSRRLAHQGAFDTTLNGGLLLCEDLTPDPGYELHWFYRPHMPCLAWSTAFHDPLPIKAGSTTVFKHALGVFSGYWTKERVTDQWLGKA